MSVSQFFFQTFDYATFLRSINLQLLETDITSWVLRYTCGDCLMYNNQIIYTNIPLIAYELFKEFFFTKPCYFFEFIIKSGNLLSYPLSKVISQMSGINTCFSPLNSFTYNQDLGMLTDFSVALNSLIRQNCNQINKICIYYDQQFVNLPMANLINLQKNLYDITISNITPYFNNNVHFFNWKLPISNAIINNANTITRFCIIDCHFPLENLSLFVNLEHLRLENFGNYTQKFTSLSSISFHHLKTFYFSSRQASTNLSIFSKFIENCGENLEEFSFKSDCLEDPNNSSLLFKSFAMKCPKLRTFEGPISHSSIDELTLFLNSCYFINSLFLFPALSNHNSLLIEDNYFDVYGYEDNYDSEHDFDGLLLSLLHTMPLNLTKLKLGNGWFISATTLYEFLEFRLNVMKGKSIKLDHEINVKVIGGEFDEIYKNYCERCGEIYNSY
ncbi:5319_t:CDS:1 [Scutellospora calospora]|uniref:5319_t:CDS:1 n=1 Tax=Scutellospora calospora TaxID=85575 RepID=A0ACA9K134_9GLOM|nr:5319_t:CDS:1 [Scutellospora calospora]